MESFDRAALVALANFVNGYAFKPEDFTEHGLPIIRIEQLKDSNAPFDFYHGKVPSEYYIENDDLIFSWSASLFLKIWTRGRAVLNQHLFKVIPKPNVDKQFLKYCIEFNLPELTKSAHGSTMQHITRRELERFFVIIPTKKDVQTKIAEVLSTVDRTIEQTEALIAKYQRIKTGLMHDLLTRGIDEHGQLRDPATHKFKDSPLGMIPDDWESVQSQGLCEEICVGIVIRPSQYYCDAGVPTLRSANIHENGISTDEMVFISEKSNRMLAKSILREGFVVSVRTGYPGTSAVVSQEFDGANCVDLIISKPGPKILPQYLALWINSPFGKNQVLRSQGGLAQQHFNIGEMKVLLIARPEIDEQKRILKAITTQNEILRLEMLSLGKLQKLKTGLMQDLLTGKVSVEPLLERQS